MIRQRCRDADECDDVICVSRLPPHDRKLLSALFIVYIIFPQMQPVTELYIYIYKLLSTDMYTSEGRLLWHLVSLSVYVKERNRTSII